MEAKEKETRKCVIGMELFYNKKDFRPKLTLANINMPTEVMIAQLRNLIKMLEEENYPDFKNNITKFRVRP